MEKVIAAKGITCIFNNRIRYQSGKWYGLARWRDMDEQEFDLAAVQLE